MPVDADSGDGDGDGAGEAPGDGALRVLRVLEVVASMEQPASLPRIAAAAGLNKMKAFRALQKLTASGYVDHVGRSGYRIGSRSVALGSLIGPRPALQHRARPVLLRLAALTSEFTTLHMRSGAHRVLVLGALPRGHAPVEVAIGERAPLTSGCSGLSILAHLPEQEAAEVIRTRPSGEPRPSTAELAKIRNEGYSLSFRSNHPGLHGIGAPLLDPLTRIPLGSISVAGGYEHLSAATLCSFSPSLLSACAELGPQLAKLLGPNSSDRFAALDVTIQDSLIEA